MKPAALLAALVFAAGRCSGEFTNSFDGITTGSGVSLTWKAVPPEQYPLYITAMVIEKKSADASGADGYRVNITTGATGTSYMWTGAPYPLRWVPGGLYQVEMRSMSWAGLGAPPLLARSPTFTISEPGGGARPIGSSSPQASPAGPQRGDAPAISKPVAIGLGVAIGVPSIAGAVVVGWCFRKRQRQAAMEKRRLKRSKFVIH
ncbi:hypothetical protein N657DRAFT_647149 [Parathielavia appendiculata]|uniref:Uncharacterized protein n=1 Tax=Parathielavia appendiculata TaxID=2587402 RepID=A0AAN6TXN6_9PEZI|nr:hypothetical protein N657DRAFT_647149 [Parathielavia appendiculata]